jgi:outer membrane protein assembly factor BamD (BamD/ComL family)
MIERDRPEEAATRYAEALKDFQVVVDSFPRSSFADLALLQMALYQLDVAHSAATAQTINEKLLKEYPDGGAAPMAYVISGRLAIMKGRAATDVEAALAAFERVPRLFPGSEAVAAAGYYTGETLQFVRRTDEALERFRRVIMDYPRSIWAARATLAAAVCYVQTDRALRGLEELQRVRLQFPGTPEATTALNYNTIIYRLYVRPPAQQPYVFSGKYVGSETAKFKDVVGVTFNDGQVMLGHKAGISIFDNKAALVKTVTAQDPSAFFVDERGRVITVRRDVLSADNGEAAAISVPEKDGKIRQAEEMPSVLALMNGDRLIADAKGKNVIRVSIAGKFIRNFAAINASRLIMNTLEDVAMIDRDSKGIVITDREGKQLNKILPKGTGYELDNPVDIGYDRFGHLYVLDRGKPAIHVFNSKYKLIASITVPEKDPGAFPKPQAFGAFTAKLTDPHPSLCDAPEEN